MAVAVVRMMMLLMKERPWRLLRGTSELVTSPHRASTHKGHYDVCCLCVCLCSLALCAIYFPLLQLPPPPPLCTCARIRTVRLSLAVAGWVAVEDPGRAFVCEFAASGIRHRMSRIFGLETFTWSDLVTQTTRELCSCDSCAPS